MVSGAAPPVVDGVGDYAAHLAAGVAELRPAWRWRHLARRARWFHPPLARRGRVTLLRPLHGWTPQGINAAVRTLRALDPDLVHVQEQIHSFYETDAAVRLAAAVRCPVVVTLHEFHLELPSVRHTIEVVKRAAAVVANDRRTADRCLEATGRACDLIAWSPSNVEPLPGVRAMPGTLTTFGQIQPLKALGVVHEAVMRLRAASRDVRWRIVGPVDPRRDRGHADLAARFGGPAVSFTGGFAAVADRRLRTLLAESSVMLLPFTDGASMRRTSLATGWAFGLPVITTPPPAVEPAIVDGTNGLLVPLDPGAWAAAIARVLDDEALAARLREGSLATARAYGWDPLARLHVEMYERLLSAPARGTDG